ELHALRVIKESGQPDSPAPLTRLNGPAWWSELKLLASLVQPQQDILMDTEIAFKPASVISVTDQPVTIQNLYARQSFRGAASFHAIPPWASVDLAPEGGERQPLSAATRLLEGPSAGFTVPAGDPKV